MFTRTQKSPQSIGRNSVPREKIASSINRLPVVVEPEDFRFCCQPDPPGCRTDSDSARLDRQRPLIALRREAEEIGPEIRDPHRARFGLAGHTEDELDPSPCGVDHDTVNHSDRLASIELLISCSVYISVITFMRNTQNPQAIAMGTAFLEVLVTIVQDDGRGIAGPLLVGVFEPR